MQQCLLSLDDLNTRGIIQFCRIATLLEASMHQSQCQRSPESGKRFAWPIGADNKKYMMWMVHGLIAPGKPSVVVNDMNAYQLCLYVTAGYEKQYVKLRNK